MSKDKTKVNKKPIIILSAGGTGGHVFPLLSLFESLKSYPIDIEWVGGSKKSMECALAYKESIKFTSLPIKGIRGKNTIQKIVSVIVLAISILKLFIRFSVKRPSLVVSFGGYASFPSSIVAAALRIPLFIHEQNSVLGLSNKILTRFTNHVWSGFPIQSKKDNQNIIKKFLWIGNPVRKAIKNIEPPKQRYESRYGKLKILILGGSQGAKSLNEAIVHWLDQIEKSKRPIIYHQAGKSNYKELIDYYSKNSFIKDIKNIGDNQKITKFDNGKVEVFSFISDIHKIYECIDIIICRSGAISVSEIIFAGIPAIFVPFPQAVDDHQYHNAKILLDNNAAIGIIRQSDLNSLSLSEMMDPFLEINSIQARKELLEISERVLQLRKDPIEYMLSKCLKVVKINI